MSLCLATGLVPAVESQCSGLFVTTGPIIVLLVGEEPVLQIHFMKLCNN